MCISITAENIWHANQAENMAKIIKKEIAAAHEKWQDGELTQALWENEAKWKSKIEDNAINEKQHRLSQQQTEETRKIEEQSQSLIKGEKEKLESGVDSMVRVKMQNHSTVFCLVYHTSVYSTQEVQYRTVGTFKDRKVIVLCHYMNHILEMGKMILR